MGALLAKKFFELAGDPKLGYLLYGASSLSPAQRAEIDEQLYIPTPCANRPRAQLTRRKFFRVLGPIINEARSSSNHMAALVGTLEQSVKVCANLIGEQFYWDPNALLQVIYAEIVSHVRFAPDVFNPSHDDLLVLNNFVEQICCMFLCLDNDDLVSHRNSALVSIGAIIRYKDILYEYVDDIEASLGDAQLILLAPLAGSSNNASQLGPFPVPLNECCAYESRDIKEVARELFGVQHSKEFCQDAINDHFCACVEDAIKRSKSSEEKQGLLKELDDLYPHESKIVRKALEGPLAKLDIYVGPDLLQVGACEFLEIHTLKTVTSRHGIFPHLAKYLDGEEGEQILKKRLLQQQLGNAIIKHNGYGDVVYFFQDGSAIDVKSDKDGSGKDVVAGSQGEYAHGKLCGNAWVAGKCIPPTKNAEGVEVTKGYFVQIASWQSQATNRSDAFVEESSLPEAVAQRVRTVLMSEEDSLERSSYQNALRLVMCQDADSVVPSLFRFLIIVLLPSPQHITFILFPF